jgi:hypothetical protein
MQDFPHDEQGRDTQKDVLTALKKAHETFCEMLQTGAHGNLSPADIHRMKTNLEQEIAELELTWKTNSKAARAG